MGYQEAMELAGATILEYEKFGSYQGDWWAKVEYNDKKGWVRGSYGSCSGCDAFQGEFGYEDHEHEDENYFDPIYNGFKDGCEKCNRVKIRLIDFGKKYLGDILTQEEAEKTASENLSWDMEADEMVKFIKDHSW